MTNAIKLPRHDDQLRSVIDELSVRGWVKISKDILRNWYSQERMSKTIWRDIASKLPEFLKDKDVMVFDYQDDILLVEKSCMKSLKALSV